MESWQNAGGGTSEGAARGCTLDLPLPQPPHHQPMAASPCTTSGRAAWGAPAAAAGLLAHCAPCVRASLLRRRPQLRQGLQLRHVQAQVCARAPEGQPSKTGHKWPAVLVARAVRENSAPLARCRAPQATPDNAGLPAKDVVIKWVARSARARAAASHFPPTRWPLATCTPPSSPPAHPPQVLQRLQRRRHGDAGHLHGRGRVLPRHVSLHACLLACSSDRPAVTWQRAGAAARGWCIGSRVNVIALHVHEMRMR